MTAPSPTSVATRDERHGGYNAYRRGCRCTACVDYQRERVARSRRQRLESGQLSHGTRSAYDAGCRCDACRARRSEISLREVARGRT